MLARICEKEHRNGEAWFLRGTILGKMGNFQYAADCLRRAIKLRPRDALGYFNLGNTLAAGGQLDDAAAAYQTAQILTPCQPDIARALARLEVKRGRFGSAIQQYCRYLEAHPNDPDVLGNLGACYFHLGELEAAVKSYEGSLRQRLEPGYMDGLGAALCRQGRISEALDVYRQAIKLQPGNARLYSNLLLTLNYLPESDSEYLLKQHQLWERCNGIVAPQNSSFCNTPDPKRRLRIGYVSPDFRTHSVAYFVEVLLANHDKTQVETYAYFCSSRSDETTERLRVVTHHWRDMASLDDEAAFEQIRADSIDILVDLAGHTAGNRLPLFRKKPAPLQITYLGYPATTGLDAMDYRLTDAFADPRNYDDHYSEELIRLPGCFICYSPPIGSPPAAVVPPATKAGYVTFGSFNNQAKINSDVIGVWSRLLHTVPDSRLLLKNPSLTDAETASYCRVGFSKHGIGPERLELIGLAPTMEDHMNTYGRVDIALDTFPYNGTTTTCEALWMGVPVISLAGRSHAGRVGVSILSTIGMEDLLADSSEGYVLRAHDLANDVQRLTKLRGLLRTRMHNSQLCDAQRFVRELESVYRDIWRRWCAGQQKS